MQRSLLFIPGPVAVAEPVLAAMARPLIDHRGPEYAALLGRIERRMRPLFGTASDVLVLGCSGTGGLEAAVTSAFSAGEKVLVCPIGVFGQRMANIARTWGLEVEIIDTPNGHALDPDALAARLRADAAHEIAGILLTQNETSTGVQNEMAPLAAAIGDHPATVIVDAVSGLGASDFRMDEWGFDIVVTASQKALAAPPGLALVAVSERGWERIERASAPRFYFDLRKARKFAAQGQTPWTPPVSISFALDVAIERYEAEGAENVWARHERYALAFRNAAEALNVAVFSQPGAHSSTVVAMNVPQGIEADALRRTLREEAGVVVGGGQLELKGKLLRFGTMGALRQTDVLGAIGALEMGLLTHGHRLQVGAGLRAGLATFLEYETAAV